MSPLHTSEERPLEGGADCIRYPQAQAFLTRPAGTHAR